MCGRFTQQFTWAELHRLSSLLVADGRNLRARYNIAPTTTAEVVRTGEDGRLILVQMRWGLVPGWWKKPLKELPATFNARAESVAEKPMFRDALRRRRCVIPVSGFYEWTGPKTGRQPHYFSAPDSQPMAFAGLWDRWRSPEGDVIDSFTIIVGAANEWMTAFHDRQPVLVAHGDIERWLAGTKDVDSLLMPPVAALREWPVSPRVNKAGVDDDDPTLIEPAA